jgi:hypothetical protein
MHELHWYILFQYVFKKNRIFCILSYDKPCELKLLIIAVQVKRGILLFLN